VKVISLLAKYGGATRKITKDVDGRTPLHVVVTDRGVNDDGPRILDILLKSTDEKNAIDDNGFTVLHYAILSGSTEMVQVCLDNGVDPLLWCDEKETAIHTAIVHTNKQIRDKILTMLLDSVTVPVDSIICEQNQHTLLYYAVRKGSLYAVQTLCARGASPLIECGCHNTTPFHSAFTQNCDDILGKIITMCKVLHVPLVCSLQIPSKVFQFTPLLLAASSSTPLVVEFILRKGCVDPNLRCDRRLPLFAALHNKTHCHAVCKILMKYDANPLITNSDGFSFLRKVRMMSLHNTSMVPLLHDVAGYVILRALRGRRSNI
jgi:ankyrin repeat protein